MIVTLCIIVLTCLVSITAFGSRKLLEGLILWPPAVANNGQVYRLITYGLVHADGQHLLFNMFTLYFFGGAMERFFSSYVGESGFALFYLGGLLASILPTYVKNRHNAEYRSLGASGAVSAVLFAFILLQPWATIYVFVLPVPAIIFAVAYLGYTIYMDRRSAGQVNHSAHLWGAIYGIVFTLVMEPRVLGAFLQALVHPRFGL
ncbi:MAG TPA: rhomboid family intramembrane serine protease [Rhodanobacteraceae bacterium]|nr:rhomboid family intramembrane serine protease [Rhodanobacteraceae bacterium]